MPNISTPLKPQWANISQADFRNNFQQLHSLQDLAAFWEVTPSQLAYYAFKIDKARAYKTFNISRRNGRLRKIEVPVGPA